MSAVASAHIALIVIAQKVSAKPEASGLPGTEVLQKLINGLLFWGLLACVAGIVLGGATWALSSHSGNHHHAGRGKMGFLASAAGALMIGASPALVNFFMDAGSAVK
jgi:cytochrome bd-type quinol oxidase subunit 2